ncbi:hypothetical protein Tco_0543003 [Tanacetum coccineum]
MHIRNDPSFFLTNKTGAPQGEELGLIKPLSDSSSVDPTILSFRKEPSIGARASVRTRHQSILNSIVSLWKTGNYLGNTSGKSRTIGTSSSRFSPDLSFSLLCSKCAERHDVSSTIYSEFWWHEMIVQSSIVSLNASSPWTIQVSLPHGIRMLFSA